MSWEEKKKEEEEDWGEEKKRKGVVTDEKVSLKPSALRVKTQDQWPSAVTTTWGWSW